MRYGRSPLDWLRYDRRVAGRTWVWVVGGAALAVACGAPVPPPAVRVPVKGAPDVVVVSIDSLRADHLGAYGYRFETSPTIDGVAAILKKALLRAAYVRTNHPPRPASSNDRCPTSDESKSASVRPMPRTTTRC